MEIKRPKMWYFSVIQQIVTLLSNSEVTRIHCGNVLSVALTEKGFSNSQCYTEDEISSRVPFCTSFPDSCQVEVLVAWETGGSRQNMSFHCGFSHSGWSLPAITWKAVDSL